MHSKLFIFLSFSSGVIVSLVENALGARVCPNLPATIDCKSIGVDPVDPVTIDPVTAATTGKYVAVCPDDKHTNCQSIGISPVTIPPNVPAEQTSVLETSTFTVTPSATSSSVPIVIPVVVPVPADPIPPPVAEPVPEPETPDETENPTPTRNPNTSSSAPGPTEEAFPYIGYPNHDELYQLMMDVSDHPSGLPDNDPKPKPKPTCDGKTVFPFDEAVLGINGFCVNHIEKVIDSQHPMLYWDTPPSSTGHEPFAGLKAELSSHAYCKDFKLDLKDRAAQNTCVAYMRIILAECIKGRRDQIIGGYIQDGCIKWTLKGYPTP